jgi:hypothetical protein
MSTKPGEGKVAPKGGMMGLIVSFDVYLGHDVSY